jgi:hypothetical protein
MKKQFHQRHALHVPRLDVMNAADIEEVVFVVIRQVAFHLRGIHAAIRLAHVDHRQVQGREYIDLHPLGQPRGILDAELVGNRLADGQRESKRQSRQGHDNGERSAKGGNDWIHRVAISESGLLRISCVPRQSAGRNGRRANAIEPSGRA